jgi:hypothetical protein
LPVVSSPAPETEQLVVTTARTVTPAALAAANLRDVRMDVSPSAEEGAAAAVEMLDFLRRC